ncbi:MAG: DNA gyrase inhibitor YacG, partial [Pseudomonadota bacterium]
AEKSYRPFCSKRCADVDLSRWLKGGYAIPGGPAEDEETVVSSDSSATS